MRHVHKTMPAKSQHLMNRKVVTESVSSASPLLLKKFLLPEPVGLMISISELVVTFLVTLRANDFCADIVVCTPR